MTTAGIEPAIFGSEDRRLIHWATRPIESWSTRLALSCRKNKCVGLSWARLVALGVTRSVVGLVVRISAFHADGPGSIPGRRMRHFVYVVFAIIASSPSPKS